jgi:hypothetical protein
VLGCVYPQFFHNLFSQHSELGLVETGLVPFET